MQALIRKVLEDLAVISWLRNTVTLLVITTLFLLTLLVVFFVMLSPHGLTLSIILFLLLPWIVITLCFWFLYKERCTALKYNTKKELCGDLSKLESFQWIVTTAIQVFQQVVEYRTKRQQDKEKNKELKN